MCVRLCLSLFECICFCLVCGTEYPCMSTHAAIPSQHVRNAASLPVAYSHAVASAGRGSGGAEILEMTNLSTRGKKARRLAELRMVCPKLRPVSVYCVVWCVVVWLCGRDVGVEVWDDGVVCAE